MRVLFKAYLIAAFLLLNTYVLHAQIITIDKTDTAAYQKKAIWNGSIASGIEIDKEKSTLFDGTSALDISLQKYKELFILSAPAPAVAANKISSRRQARNFCCQDRYS